MEYQTADTSSTIAPVKPNNYRKFFAISLVIELVLILLAFIRIEGGIWSGGISKFFSNLGSGYFDDGDRLNILIRSTVFAILTLITISVGLYYHGKELTGKIPIFFTIIFGYSLTASVNLATRNFIFMYFTITFISALYWYWLRFDEVRTFFDNRIIIFALRRSLAILPLFLAISLFTYFALNYIGDPVKIAVARIRVGRREIEKVLLRRYGLVDDQGNRIPVWRRYLSWLYDFFHGDMGISYESNSPVENNITNLLWETLKMQVIALILAFVLSVVIGILAAYYHKTAADSMISAIALLGLSMPIFVSGILAILIFGGIGLNWFPTAGAHTIPELLVRDGCQECIRSPDEIFSEDFNDNYADFGWWKMYLNVWWVYTGDTIMHLALPVLTLTFATMATFARLTRSTMLEVMKQDYILAARANGLSETQIVTKHALKNVLLPLVTFLGISVGFLLAGAPITESVFSWPGLGNFFLSALTTLDMPIIMALTMIITLMILFANLMADIAYTFLDPRVTL